MKKIFILITAWLSLGIVATQSFAAYPETPITMVVPYAPAGSTDVMGRMLAQTMSKNLGQPVVVDNTGGAGGTIGALRVVRAPADGLHGLSEDGCQ